MFGAPYGGRERAIDSYSWLFVGIKVFKINERLTRIIKKSSVDEQILFYITFIFVSYIRALNERETILLGKKSQ